MIAGHRGWTPEHAVLSDMLADRTGLTFAPFSRAQVASRIDRAMRRCRARDAAEYLACVGRDAAQLDALLLELTVGETYFFRDEAQFDLLRHTILPAIARSHDGPVRIWSAGCATGEEPYSLAILLDQLGLAERSRILATDLCRGRLAHAARARYGTWSFRRPADDTLHRYFTRVGDDVEVDARIRASVTFQADNLAGPDDRTLWIEPADLVMCRNVLIYLRPDVVRSVARRLVSALRPGGWLVLGASDPYIGDAAPCEVITTDAGLVYRAPPPRPATGSPTVCRAAPLPTPAPVAAPSTRAIGGGTTVPAVRAAMAPGSVRAERRGDGSPMRPVERIRAMIRRGDLPGAGRVCAAALDQHRASPALHYLHAILLAAGGHGEEATIAARRVIYLERDSPLGYLALAQARVTLGDAVGVRRALHEAERALAPLPDGHPMPAVEGETAAEVLRFVRLSLERSR